MSKTDWLGTAAAKEVKRLIEGLAEMTSDQALESLKNIQLLQTEAAHSRKEVLLSLAISHINMRHSLDLMRLPLDKARPN